jgi:nucleotide-binding universal stress UspA family protein
MVFERILVPLDGSERAERALVHAGYVARVCSATVHLLRVLDTSSAIMVLGTDSTEWRLRNVEAARYLKNLVSHPALAGVDVETLVLEGRAADQIVEFVHRADIDLVVMSAHGQGDAANFPFGGTAQKIAMQPGISCLILRDDEGGNKPGYHRVLVPLDCSRRSEWAVQVARALTLPDDELLLLHVIAIPEMPRRRPLTDEENQLRDRLVECNRTAANEYLAALRRRKCSDCESRVRVVESGRIAQSILDVADEEDADLIILATHELDDEDAVSINTVCQYILQHSPKPVLVLESGGCANPSGSTTRQQP